MKKLKFLLLVLFCNVDLITCASLPNKKVKINPFEKLIENPDVFAHALSYLSFKDNLNVVLASKYFQKIVMNKVPLTVKLVDELTKDQLNFIKKWNFENLNVGYKIKDTINQESINLINQFLNDMPEELNYDIISESTLYIPSQKVTHNNEVKDVPELYIINRSDNAKMYLSVKDYNSVNEINQAILYMVKKDNPIETLVLKNLHIDEQGFEDILKALKNKISLKRFSLGSFKLHAPITLSVTNALRELFENNNYIKEIGFNVLNSQNDKTIFDVLQVFKSSQIEELSFDRDPITERVGQSIAKIINNGKLKGLRVLLLPTQSSDGLKHVFNSLNKNDTIDRVLIGGFLNPSSTQLKDSLANYIKNTKKLKLLHVIDFEDWSNNQQKLIESIGKNRSISILKLQFPSRNLVQCHDLILKLKLALINHPSIENLTLENVNLNADCYDAIADILNQNNKIIGIELSNIEHNQGEEEQLIQAFVKN